ncbi:MAG: PLP-dependent aminotransferase family protein [Woeseiaceae bacterium]|nr:PLP-dependent aminotransferase family protein [Woeseiaceae bacterium]
MGNQARADSSAGNVVTFDDAPEPGFINFGVGQPSADLLSVELLNDASERFFADAQPFDFNYGSTQGDPRYLAAVSDFLGSEYGQPVSASDLLLTGGNSQALDFVCNRFTQPGDTVFVEDPSYFLAFQILRDHGLNVVGMPIDDDGLIVEDLEPALKTHRPSLVYTIPSYHNPTGRTMSKARRERLVALSKEYDFVIAADEVYQLLYFGDPPPPAMGTYAGEGNVLSLGSFSKILAPAMRLGWIQTDEHHMERLLASGMINSGGSFSHFSSHLVRNLIEADRLAGFVRQLRTTFRARVDAMDRALQEHVGGRARWIVPQGGYFFWLELTSDTDAEQLRQHAGEFQTGFQPGPLFSPESKRLDRFIRLSFAHYTEPDIEEGVARIGRLLDRYG